jgi:hypothetical protein
VSDSIRQLGPKNYLFVELKLSEDKIIDKELHRIKGMCFGMLILK